MSRSRIVHFKDSISFNGMTEEQARRLALAFAGACIHACYFHSADEEVRWVVNIMTEGGKEDENK